MKRKKSKRNQSVVNSSIVRDRRVSSILGKNKRKSGAHVSFNN
jgi:hypothetical protein